MKTIRSKVLVYLLVFVVLFYIIAISIFMSSNRLTSIYNDSFKRFLLLNSISQYSDDLYTKTRTFVVEADPEKIGAYYKAKQNLKEKLKHIPDAFRETDPVKLKNYRNLLKTFIHESELAAGFSLRDDIEQYTYHLDETRNTANYIHEMTLELINAELTAYQSFYQDLQDRNHSFFYFIIFLFLTTIILVLVFALWFSDSMTRPVRKLSKAAREVSAGYLTGEPVMIQSKDEMKLLGDTFNHMRTNIFELVQEIKDQSELDQLLKDMELKHLQSQINPHFLFNTLNTLSKMAYLEDAHSTSSLIESVATLLRHNLGEINKQVTLGDEIEVVDDYFHIQKTRFSERVTFTTEIDPTCLEIEIPRLTLQPLMENAFIHGIEEREEGGAIKLSVYHEADQVIVKVVDNGVGMPQEKVDELMKWVDQEGAHTGHSTGIGLVNVMRRLQLFYRTTDVLTIQSKSGDGTTVCLFLPSDTTDLDVNGL